jgi:hypothetical protein
VAVFLLWHVAHQNNRDDAKLLGVYSSRAKAEARITSARLLPGFADEPECFTIDEYTIDQDEWVEGFGRV